MGEKTDAMNLLDKERTAEIPTSMEPHDMPAAGEGESFRPLHDDVRKAEEDLVTTVKAIRTKLSYASVKSRVLEGMRERALIPIAAATAILLAYSLYRGRRRGGTWQEHGHAS